MKEIASIIKSYERAVEKGQRIALATLVHVDGSSYRRPGARMLITEDGALTGAISGGCLEGDALRKALLVIMEQRPMLVTYDTSDEADAVLGMGLGCNGIIQVLIEPVIPQNPLNPLALLMKARSHKKASVLVTLFVLENRNAPQPGTCMLYTNGEWTAGNELARPEPLLKDAKAAMLAKHSSFRQYLQAENAVTAFIEYIPAPFSLFIIGAGNDTIPLAQMAEILGWETTIVDGRPAYAKRERFPASCQVMLARPEQIVGKLSFDERTAVVLMTHNYIYDLALLKLLVQQDLTYIGMLGPKKKLERMSRDLENTGLPLTSAQLAIIHSPVGLDIGAETPEEIALSIVSEIQAVFANALAIPLKTIASSIHSRAELAIGILGPKDR